MLAHQRDDQAETHLMRRARSAGPGEAGMPARRIVGGVRLLRPLLGADGAALRAYLARRELDWLEDPSNLDRRFERVRLRQSLTAQTKAAALARARRRGRTRHLAERAVAGAAAEVASPSPAGYCLVAPDLFATLTTRLGLDPGKSLYAGDRPITLVDSSGKPLHELLPG